MFAYCANNPVNNTDASGKDWWHWAVAAAIVVVAAAAVVVTAGGAGPAVAAVAMAANGVATCSTATTVAAGVFVASSTALATSAYSAALESQSLDEFASYGEGALFNTATAGLYGGAAAYAMQKSQTPSQCFVAGTLVLAEGGKIPIENIQSGDFVWAWDEETGDVALKRVVETYVNETDELIHIFVNGEEIVTTPSHPFYSPVKGWTDAVHLRAGDILVLVNGEYVIVEKIQHEILEAPIEVYNFQVEDYHTYYVADAGVLVHNRCSNPYGKKGSPAHQGKIQEIGADLESRGYTVTYEYQVNTSGGIRNTRFIDVYGTNGTDSIGIQVGRMTQGGLPVSRERYALLDLISAGKTVIFVAYK